MQGIGHELAEIVECERRQLDPLDPRSGLADRLQRAQERVRGADLVVPVGADQQQVPYLPVGDQMLEEVECRRVQPLQIVEEQHERVLRRGEYAEEPPEHRLEAVLRVLRREVRNGRLFPDDELDLGDEADDAWAVWADGLRLGTAARGN